MKKHRLSRLELLALGVFLLAAATACIVVLMFPPGSPEAQRLPKCLFHEWTGLYCPGCGTTRALYALMHGDLKTSLHENLLLIPAGLTATALIVKPRIGLCRPVAIAIIVVVVGFTVLRNIPCEPFTALAPVPLP